ERIHSHEIIPVAKHSDGQAARVLECKCSANGMPRSRADRTATVVSHEAKRSVELIGFSRPANRQTSEGHRLFFGKFPYGHRHFPQRHRLTLPCRRLAGPVVPMR